MLKIGVISDTHLERVTHDFQHVIEKFFNGVDMIIHSGDMVSRNVYDYLSNWEIKAVCGNMDNFELHHILPDKRVEEIGGKKIGIIHGWGSPYGLSDLVYKEFQGVDIIVFGHSHTPFHKKKGNVELFNPGAFKALHGQPGTLGMIEIDDVLTFRHIEIK